MNSLNTTSKLSNRILPAAKINYFFAAMGIVATFLCGVSTLPPGLGLLFLLPVSFTVCTVVFYRAFSYWKDNLSFIIIFATIFIRYLANPVLMTISQSPLNTVHPSAIYYRYAIIIQVFELVATLAIIDYVWTRHKKKMINVSSSDTTPRFVDFKLSWLGALFILALAFLVLTRGHMGDLINRYSTWWHISDDFSAVFFYDYISVEIIKSVLGIVIIAFMARCYRKVSSPFERTLFYLLAMAVGICMTMIYMYDQRTALVQLIISSLVLLLAFFPQAKKTTLVIFVFGGSILVAYVFATGTLNYEVGSTSSSVSTAELSKMAELYVSGPSMIAITQQNYDWIRSHMSPMTYLSDIITTSHIFGMFPFLRGINDIALSTPTSNQLFVESLGGLTYILPNYSLWTYYAGQLFGWLFEILSIFLVVKVICKVDEKRKTSTDACYFYSLAYAETLLGQAIFVNNTFLLWHAFTNLPFWLLRFACINNFGKSWKIK